jgi:hypothetical protein
MTNKHNKSFFGNTTGIILESSSKKEPFIFLRCLKKKSDGAWEKTSKGEGKIIKLSLEEIIMVLKVLQKELPSWNTYHSYKDTKTQISFNWQNGQQERLWINIGEYSKMLSIPEIEVLKRLLDHILDEKIEFSTISEYQNGISNNQRNNTKAQPYVHPEKRKLVVTEERYPPEPENQKSEIKEEVKTESETMTINGTVQRITEKAVFIQFSEESEAWIPKSTMHYIEEKDIQVGQNYTFTIETWVLKKNNII